MDGSLMAFCRTDAVIIIVLDTVDAIGDRNALHAITHS